MGGDAQIRRLARAQHGVVSRRQLLAAGLSADAAAHKLVLEFDGYGTHGSRAKFESDRKRDQDLATRGIQTLRATWLQLVHEPVALVVRIGQALTART